LKRRTLRRYGTVLALMGLAFRLLIAAVHVPPAAAGALPASPGLFSQIVLCTASGFRVVQLDEDGNPVEPGHSPPQQSCPICTALSGAPLALAPSMDLLPVAQFADVFISEHRTALVAGRKPLVTRGRDPPHQA
jgi:Protein of unknown function (DUF2946)